MNLWLEAFAAALWLDALALAATLALLFGVWLLALAFDAGLRLAARGMRRLRGSGLRHLQACRLDERLVQAERGGEPPSGGRGLKQAG